MVGGTSRSGKAVRCPWEAQTNLGCSETIKRVLAFPPDTNIVWKSHDDSIAQRSALDEARQQKAGAPPPGRSAGDRLFVAVRRTGRRSPGSRHDGRIVIEMGHAWMSLL